MRYRVTLDGFPTDTFGPEDQDTADPRPWDKERAWDCYKRRYGATVRVGNHDKIPVIEEVG